MKAKTSPTRNLINQKQSVPESSTCEPNNSSACILLSQKNVQAKVQQIPESPLPKVSSPMTAFKVPQAEPVPLGSSSDSTRDETKPLDQCIPLCKVTILSLLSTGLMILGSVLYLGMAFACAFDQREKEAYFDEDPLERTFKDALRVKALNPTWTLKTDDWGYIERTYYRSAFVGGAPFWEDCGIFAEILLTAGSTSLFWTIVGYFLIKMYKGRQCCAGILGVVLAMVGLIPIISGNVLIYKRISKFKDITDKLLADYDASDFKQAFYRSVNYYDYTARLMFVLVGIQLITSFLYCFKKGDVIVPEKDKNEDKVEDFENKINPEVKGEEKPKEAFQLKLEDPMKNKEEQQVK